MTDYTRGTGSSGTMMIRDTGSTIEFWINSNNGTTFSDHIPWSGTVNDTNISGSYNYPAGAGWRRIGVWGVGYSQFVTFKLGSTGTSGFGGPTTLGPIYINRATVPPAPSPVSLSGVTNNSVNATYTGNGDGGAAVDDWVLGYGTDPNYPQIELHHTVTTTITGLTPGTTYYFWAHGHNSQGWGPWSNRTQITTLRAPDPPSAPLVIDVGQVSVTLTFTPNYDGGSPITQYNIGYSLDPVSITDQVHGVGSPATISNLSPGQTYYFWTQAQNAYGGSVWSANTAVTLIAGAYVNIGEGVWKRAVPYVKVDGLWKVARAWGRVAGTWRETL